MDVRAIKHVAKMTEWSERIRACRSSGMPVKEWCAENRVGIKSYYRWERLYMAEASMHMQLTPGETSERGALVRIEPDKLPVARETTMNIESAGQNKDRRMVLRHGAVTLELPEEMAVERLAELMKALGGV